MDEITKQKIIAWLRPAGFVFLVVGISIIVYLVQRGPGKKEEGLPAQQKPLTEKEIIKSLSAPPDAKPQYSEKELETILKSLSAPRNSKSALSPDQEKRVLESLSAPSNK